MESHDIGFYWDDFEVGKTFVHSLSKTIFESDNNLFCLLTMNFNPVHTNVDYAAKNQHGRILVVGTLVFSLVVGMTVPDISGKAIANLCYEDIQHLGPVFIGDTIYSKTIILEKYPSNSKKDRGIVYVKTIGYNQNGEEVISFKRKVLVKRREYESSI